MPYKHLTDETEWKMGVTVLGKVVKPGSKIVVHKNGNTSLNFSLMIPSGIPWDKPIAPGKHYAPIYWRCRMFFHGADHFLLYTSDVVRVSGVMNKIDKDPGLLVNKIEILARWLAKGVQD